MDPRKLMGPAYLEYAANRKHVVLNQEQLACESGGSRLDPPGRGPSDVQPRPENVWTLTSASSCDRDGTQAKGRRGEKKNTIKPTTRWCRYCKRSSRRVMCGKTTDKKISKSKR
ncbi:hypothetical protein F2P81_012175 [Scophthalmus maximus]|uniref:Uncharacterized protein n=1 Tax=Scophthalmus maximus TaxID=52904 RepID=A0A6A4SML6_SCOMX|nr:hypothetical protein F2P81_012175 [Scophthalmus maximus]